jgi:hypothetical protein
MTIRVINMGEMHDLTLDIVNTLVAKFSPKGLTLGQRIGLKSLKQEILKTKEADLLDAMIDVDKKIRKVVYAEDGE